MPDRSSKRRRSVSPKTRSRSRSRDRNRRHRSDRASNHHKSRYSRDDDRRSNGSNRSKAKRSGPRTKREHVEQFPSKSLQNDSKKSVTFDKSSKDDEDTKKEKKKEDFNQSGALKQDLESTKNGVVLKYSEPPEGTLCHDRKWRLYCYKGDEQLNVSDIVSRHISVSSQHAVIQYRRVKTANGFSVKPYLMDLKSRHGTVLSGGRLESHRFYEILAKDVLQFGTSTRKYVVLADDSIEKDLENRSEIQSAIKSENEGQDESVEQYQIWSDDDD